MEARKNEELDDIDPMTRPFSSEIVEIKVGPNEDSFRAHKDILVARSPFFKSCLQSPCQESSSNVVELPTDDPEAFNRALKWMYGQQYTICRPSKGGMEYDPKIDAELPHLIKAWIMGDQFCMEEFKNALMDSIRHALHRTYVDSDSLDTVDEDAPESALGTFFVEQMAYEVGQGYHNSGNCLDYDAEIFFKRGGTLVVEIVHALGRGIKEEPARATKCKYHEHKETKKCL